MVLVTGVNGLVASNVMDQLLKLGYLVRGTVRSRKAIGWVPSYFGDKYGLGTFEIILVPDISVPGAFNDAVKGKFLVHCVSLL